MLNTPRTLDADYFATLYEERQDMRIGHASEIWESRAQKWIDELGAEGMGKPDMTARIDNTVRYLRSRGLLGVESSVIDIGCGPGLFVMEFAKTALYAVGLDRSERFVEYGAERAKARGLSNTSFVAADFTDFDIEKAGYAGAFDLVFASITPAATSKDSIEKMMKMSKGFCCNVSFVNVSDSLAQSVSRDVFGEEYRPRYDGMGFYALLNMLWLQGYYPETTYYTDSRVETVAPDERSASDCAALCGHGEPEDAAKVLRYLAGQGEIERCSDYRFGSILWDVRMRDKRTV